MPTASRLIHFCTRNYERLLYVLLAVSPLVAIAYLQCFQSIGLRFEHHLSHQFLITLAIAQSLFITYVTWRCYRDSGEPLLRWLTLAFLGFSVVYLPHGLFTGLAHWNPMLFLLYGPASRLAMNACLLAGAIAYGRPAEPEANRSSRRYWLSWVLVYLLVDLLVAGLAFSPLATHPVLRLSLEGSALLLALAALAVMVGGRHRMPLLNIYAIAMALFAQASFSFILAQAWNHQWWLAHAIAASGFLLLSFGVVRAFHTTRSFATVYSQEEIIERLQQTNDELQRLATTDVLTGIANRRHFLARLDSEQSRAQRTASSFVILALDLDHFKNVNDRYGHQAGDEVLRQVTQRIGATLRSSDLQGRMGGEEFAVLLPETPLAEGVTIAERICRDVADLTIFWENQTLQVTISIGVAAYPGDGDNGLTVYGQADRRLYAAKRAGRNRVCGCDGD